MILVHKSDNIRMVSFKADIPVLRCAQVKLSRATLKLQFQTRQNYLQVWFGNCLYDDNYVITSKVPDAQFKFTSVDCQL